MNYREARELLGVPAGATSAELKQAYRRAARRAHPDKGGDEEEFGRIRTAYHLLTAPQAVRFVKARPRWRSAVARLVTPQSWRSRPPKPPRVS